MTRSAPILSILWNGTPAYSRHQAAQSVCGVELVELFEQPEYLGGLALLDERQGCLGRAGAEEAAPPQEASPRPEWSRSPPSRTRTRAASSKPSDAARGLCHRPDRVVVGGTPTASRSACIPPRRHRSTWPSRVRTSTRASQPPSTSSSRIARDHTTYGNTPSIDAEQRPPLDADVLLLADRRVQLLCPR